MGTFQSGINNILGATAVAATTIKDTKDKKDKAIAEENEKKALAAAKEQKIQAAVAAKEQKAQEAAAAKEKEAQEKAAEQEKKDIAKTESKLRDARLMAIGYSEGEIRKKEASAALGIEDNKLPKSIKQKTYDRRFANAQAMEAIHTRYAQNKEFRQRLEKLSSKDIAKAIKPEINKTIKKKEVANNGK